MSWIITKDGQRFDFNRPDQYRFDIDTIAHSLSMINRWNGHTKFPYSVAQHSVSVASVLPEKYKLAGLMHDAAEAFIGDVSSPLKELLPELKAIEKKVEKALFTHFGIEYPLPTIVKDADRNVGVSEYYALMGHESWEPEGIIVADGFPEWSPELAYCAFISMFESLNND